ncbi:unnamed protein product [Closterium sp. NIES-54]
MKNQWVLTTKYLLDDAVEREKVRLVVKGFTQVCGAHYGETYSPVSSYVTVRIFLNIVAIFDLNLMQLDMKNAFLQSKLDRVLYIKLGSGLTVRSDQHWREVDRCLAYLADTRDTALEFGGGPESLELIGYVDADEVGNKQKRTSTSGYVFVYGGAVISWSSSRIKCATLSSTESEYIAARNAGKEGRRLPFLLAEFKLLDARKPTILRVDNKSAITVAEGLGLTGNLKHMERRYAWLQHMVRRGKFVLKYIPTTEQPADFLTKPLHFPSFNRCSVAIGQVCLADVGNGADNVQQ